MVSAVANLAASEATDERAGHLRPRGGVAWGQARFQGAEDRGREAGPRGAGIGGAASCPGCTALHSRGSPGEQVVPPP